MTIVELKNQIENNTLDSQSLIFVYKDSLFILDQYFKQLSRARNQEIKYIDDIELEGLLQYDIYPDCIKIHVCDEFNMDISNSKNIFVFCKKSSINHIDIPELQDWQIVDYIKSSLKGISEDNIDDFVKSYTNIYRTAQEIDKLKLFPPSQRERHFKAFRESGLVVCDAYSAFDLVNSVTQNNIENINKVYLSVRDSLDGFNLLGLLYSNFRDIIKVQLYPKSTAEKCEIQANRFYVIKNYYINFYTKEQLLKIFKFLTNIQNNIVKGELQVDNLSDYIIIKILSIGKGV